MINHIGIGVADYEKAKTFYTAALARLGVTIVMEFPAEKTENGAAAAGLGRDGDPAFWIAAEGRTTPPMHVALTARTHAEVDAFHAAALAAGATDNGPPWPAPALRPQLLRRLRPRPRRPQPRSMLQHAFVTSLA